MPRVGDVCGKHHLRDWVVVSPGNAADSSYLWEGGEIPYLLYLYLSALTEFFTMSMYYYN